MRRAPAVAMGLALLAPAAGHAAEQKGPAFGIRPLDAPKGYFQLQGEPGATVRAALEITNPGRRPVTVELRAQDAGTAATGGVQYEPPKPGGVGRWLTTTRQRVKVAPGKARRVTLAARIPADARPGEHYGGIAAYDVADLRRVKKDPTGGGVQLKFLSRFGITIRYRVPGPAKAQLDAAAPTIESTPAGAAVNVQLRNTGAKLIEGTTGSLEVHDEEGERAGSAAVELTSFLPATRLAVPVPLDDGPQEGTYRVTGTLTPEGAPPVRIDQTVRFGEREAERHEAATGKPPAKTAGPPAWLPWALAPGLLLVVFALGRASGRGATSSAPRRATRRWSA